MPFTLHDALRVLRECRSPLNAAYFGTANQAVLQAALADRVQEATGIRIADQDLLVCMVRAYQHAPRVSTDLQTSVNAINVILLGAVAPYVIRSIKTAGWHATRFDAGVTGSTAPPLITPVITTSVYDTSTPEPPVGAQVSALASAPV